MTSFDAIIGVIEQCYEDNGLRWMTISYASLRSSTGVAEKTALIREALKALIERESARRLASLEGTCRN